MDGRQVDEYTGKAAMNWLSKLSALFDKRRSRRLLSPPLMAFYWDGGNATPHPVPDISHGGVFVKTPDRWSPRTLIRITLQRKSEDPQESDESITVQCRVVRAGEDGVGMAIMLAENNKREHSEGVGSLATRKQLNAFLEHLREDANGTPGPETPYLPFPRLTPLTDPPTLEPTTDDTKETP